VMATVSYELQEHQDSLDEQFVLFYHFLIL
jgi:hypothetical protein